MGGNSKGNKNLNGIAGIITAVGTVVTISAPLIEKAIDRASTQSRVKSVDKVKVPELYRKGFPIDLDQAIKILGDCGLKYSTSKLTMKEANPKYKDYLGSQVIDSNPKQGAVVKIGSTICLRYIPEEVIVESQKIFDEVERSKIEAREKRTKQKEQIRESVMGSVDRAIQDVGKVLKRKDKETILKEGEITDE